MEEVKQSLAPVLEKFCDRIAVAYLFDSRARRDAGPKSNIDLAVLLHDTARQHAQELRLDFYADCCRALKRNDIDIVVMNITDNLFLLDDIVSHGVILYQCDAGLREEYEVQVHHDFIDFRDHRRKILGV